MQRPPGKLPKGLDQNDLTRYVESFHSLPQEWKHYLVYLRKAKNKLKQKKDGDGNKSGTDYITSKAFNARINEINASIIDSKKDLELILTAAFAEQMKRIELSTNRNRIGRITSSERSVVVNSLIKQDEVTLTTTTCEFDTHADTSVLGSNFRPIEYTHQKCNVYGFHGTSAILDVPIVNGATALHLLVINQGIYLGSKLDHSLLNLWCSRVLWSL